MGKRILTVWFLYVLLAVVAIPLIITTLAGGFSKKEETQQKTEVIGAEEVFPSELEEYVVGVVAAEMPAAFPIEALKAQAVAARTYQVRAMEGAGSEAVLYDAGQAYSSVAEQKKKWGDAYGAYSTKIRQAVQATEGEIMVYEGEPILAAFHAQSAGMTEAAENVWSSPVPYLKSVDSAEDKKAPQNEVTVEIPANEVKKKLGIEQKAGEISFTIAERSQAGYVLRVRVGQREMTGREVREGLGLRSTDFTVERKGDSFIFTTKGYGHGVGMSQYGASFLAEKGMAYQEILQHYYQGISFEKIA